MLRVRASKCWSCGGLGSERRQTALTASGTRSTKVPLQGPDPEAQKGKWNHLLCSMSLSNVSLLWRRSTAIPPSAEIRRFYKRDKYVLCVHVLQGMPPPFEFVTAMPAGGRPTSCPECFREIAAGPPRTPFPLPRPARPHTRGRVSFVRATGMLFMNTLHQYTIHAKRKSRSS
jgi:hypothetical protein